jgi:hypothetical protein
MPDNKQIDETLQYFLDHSIVDMSKLSSEGKHLVNVVQSCSDPHEAAFGTHRTSNTDVLVGWFNGSHGVS